jgi:CBS-domain-containing membrane protein
MARDVVSVRPDTDVAEAIKLLAEHDVGALPVLDRDDNLVGMLSDAEPIHRAEIGSEAERKALLTLAESMARVSRVAAEMIPAY